MKEIKYQLIASAGTKEELEKLINKFYCSENYEITEDNKLYNKNFNAKKLETINNNIRIVFNGKRWRFEFK